MIYTYLVPSDKFYLGGEVKFDCETKELYYVSYVSEEHITKHNASLRNFRDLVKSLNGTKRATARCWKKFYSER